MTYSIVARDPGTGRFGVAVQSHYLGVGPVVPWLEAGVGAVATQASVNVSFGPIGLELLRAGRSADEVVASLVAGDERPAIRQLGVVDATGRAAAHTGAECIPACGHLVGDGYTVQGNLLAGEAVVQEMARAFEAGAGALCQRLLAALEAGQAAGGDKRGEQSAALIVERSGYAQETRLGIDRVIDLRVDDHPHPIAELRRLLDLRLRQEVAFRAMRFYLDRDFPRAVAIMADGLRQFPDSPEILYDLACFESLAGQPEACLVHLARALDLAPGMRPMAAADADFDAVRSHAQFLALVAGA